MSRKLLMAAAAVLMIGGPGAALAQMAPPAYVAAAVADTARPEADTKRDADRKPAETVAFAGVKPGDQVAEILPGGGYFTRILSKTVGPKGHVYAVINPPTDPAKPPAILAVAADPAYANVTVETTGLQTIKAPVKVDVVWTSQNYHDMHNIKDFDMLAANKSVYDVLKPGGVFLVLDHAAAAGAPADVTSTLHRIDPAVVKSEVEAAGFKFEGESKILAHAADDHTLKVFDPALRGHTDQFIYKFRKPK
ncbi:MAG: hypothetical protein JWO33_51 [Caulobacteraceae bacterium]|nr:hypothetical protein [Caulobacteraceae bacterium]